MSTDAVVEAMLGRGVDREAVEAQLRSYPKLHHALFPASASDSLQHDINVYQLLVGNAKLNPRRLFSWQPTNTLRNSDSKAVFPDFTQAELVTRFAHTEKIGYTYYLRQGRPTYALCAFLAEELDLGVTSISTKRIQAACGVALWVAGGHFSRTEVVAACVAFVEMLGQDSLLLRTMVHAALEILAFQTRRLGKTAGAERKKLEDDIVVHIQLCLKSRRRHGPKLLGLLEKAITDSVTNDGLDCTSFAAGMRWFLAVVFCQQLRLPQSTHFLEICASNNKWLPFLWYSQMHQIPRHQLQGILHLFRSRHLRDHLHYVIENAEARSVFKREASTEQPEGKAKDTRSHLYSKIGLAKEKADNGQNSSDEEAETSSSDYSLIVTAGDADLLVSEEAAEEDVFGVLFAAQATRCPWKSLLIHATVLRNPLFAELAACHTDAILLACLCGWLVAMATPAQHAQFLEGRGGRSVCGWGHGELEELVSLYLEQGWHSSLATAFHIFTPDCPLLPLLRFVAEACQKRNFVSAQESLQDFKDVVNPLPRRAEEAAQCGSLYRDRDEVEAAAFHILASVLTRAPSQYQTLQLLRLLDHENITLLFSFDVPDFGKLHKMMALLHSHSVPVRLSVLMEVGSEESRGEWERVLSCLVEKQAFSDACTFAGLAGIPPDQVIVQQVLAEKRELQSTGVWQARVTRAQFWHRCLSLFLQHDLEVNTVTAFFQGEATEAEQVAERGLLYRLILDCLERRGGGREPQQLEQAYRLYWDCRIQAQVQGQQMAERSGEAIEEIFAAEEWPTLPDSCQASSELLYCGKMPSRHEVGPSLSLQELEALDVLIGQKLGEGKLREACRLATIFSHYSPDLTIILSCIRLALGTVTVDTLDMEVQVLMSRQQQEKRPSLMSASTSSLSLASLSRAASVASLANVAGEEQLLGEEKERTIQTMETLLNRCSQGSRFCARVVAAYKAACLLDITYDDLVGQDEFTVLEHILRTKFASKLALARDFLSTSSLSDNEVVSFLAQTIIKSLKVCLEDSSKLAETEKPSSSGELLFRPTQGLPVFQQFINLCQNTSLLGDRLLEAVAELALEEQTPSVLSIQTELLILAHESHTAACSMEGISHVLRAARILTDQLAAAQEFTLMIRLLTGVGRFSEMTFIFDTIMQHHRFEQLMKRGIEKVEGLKVALLDYLKRYHPGDKDTFTMVALNFTMYRQIAAMLEARGHQEMEELAKKPLENTREIQDQVKKCIQYFADAADSYVKEKCIRHATSCIQWARLATLQLQLLPSGVQVFLLTPEQVVTFVTNNPRLREALVVAEAYGKAPWAAAIHQHVILGGDFNYLNELSVSVQITPALIQEAIARFQQSSNKSDQALTNIRKLLTLHCRDFPMQYRIAQELGLTDVVNQCLRGEPGLYLKDVMTFS